MTPSERYVSELCKQSFLPFWSFANPVGKNNKELCDVLVVCGCHIIIVSVKDIAVSSHLDELVQYERWANRAIHESVDQLYGAERFLKTCNEFTLSDRKSKITLPPLELRKVYRIAVAFGSGEGFYLPTGDFGKGFVHVFNERSTLTLLNELDTITDFTTYLTAKEDFVKGRKIIVRSENDFLAIYMETNFEFDHTENLLVCNENVWDGYVNSEVYKEWRKRVEPSFFWDDLIRHVYYTHVHSNVTDARRAELEEAMRFINLEPRLNRIELGSVVRDGLKSKVHARMIKPHPGQKHTYVILPLTDENWEGKEGELKLRCIIARAENPLVEHIIGIALGGNSKGENCFDVCYFSMPAIDQNFIDQARAIQDEFGYFKNMKFSHSVDFRE